MSDNKDSNKKGE